MGVKETVKPQISVIVPIYNVEKYVRKCLESLKNQTMKEIEVICIDDGSTDMSGAIADGYQSDGWPKFRIIHTENRGLSAARNCGIDAAIADWLMFVDSDDWVDKQFCEIPYRAMVENRADMVIFRTFSVKKNEKTKNLYKRSIISAKAVDAFTAHECGKVVVWNKMYAKKLFEDTRYPEGRLYEDIATTHKIVNASKCIIMIDERLYYHVVRRGSISCTYTESNRKNCFIANLERYNDLIAYGYPEEKVKPELCSSAFGYLASSGQKIDELHKEAEKIIDSLDCFPHSYPLWKKIALFAWKMDKRMFYMISKLSGRMNRT